MNGFYCRASNGEVCESAAEKKVSLVESRPHYRELFPYGFYRELSLPENSHSEKVTIMSGWIKSRRRQVFLLCREGELRWSCTQTSYYIIQAYKDLLVEKAFAIPEGTNVRN